jgi:hypothetical protein
MTGVWLRSKVNSMVLPGSSVFQEWPEFKFKIKIKIIYAGSGIGYFVLKLRNKNFSASPKFTIVAFLLL